MIKISVINLINKIIKPLKFTKVDKWSSMLFFLILSRDLKCMLIIHDMAWIKSLPCDIRAMSKVEKNMTRVITDEEAQGKVKKKLTVIKVFLDKQKEWEINSSIIIL